MVDFSSTKGPQVEDGDAKAVVFWAEDEFERLQAALLGLPTLELRTSYNPPLRPQPGMIAYADGTKWNPGYGEGGYVQNSAGLWVPLSTTVSPVVFPAAQVASSDPNTLDDYEEGFWTPTLSFATPGDLAVTYNFRNAYYTKVGRLATISFALILTPFTWTTAAGGATIGGLPFVPMPSDTNYRAYAPLLFAGVTKAGYSAVILAIIGNNSTASVLASGSGVAIDSVNAADMPSGGTPVLAGSVSYVTAT